MGDVHNHVAADKKRAGTARGCTYGTGVYGSAVTKTTARRGGSDTVISVLARANELSANSVPPPPGVGGGDGGVGGSSLHVKLSPCVKWRDSR